MATILIVDDEIDMCNALEMFLTFKGYACKIAHSGGEALDILHAQRIDLVLMDVMMPGMNGFEASRRIKNDESLKFIPIIMITALSEKKDRIQGIEAGVDDFINKPIDHSEVLARIKMLLKLKQANDVLSNAFEYIHNLIVYGEETLKSYNSIDFDFASKIDGIVDRIIRKKTDMVHQPEGVVVGYAAEDKTWSWQYYESVMEKLNRSSLDAEINAYLQPLGSQDSKIGFLNQDSIAQPEFSAFIKALEARGLSVRNMVYYRSRDMCLFTLNHGREVGRYDAAILYSMVTIGDSLRSLALQAKETEGAFEYAIHALARASEVNDEDTGQHIWRVGEYAGFIAEKLGLPEKTVKTIHQQAPLHDVGKLYIPSAILKKAGKFSEEEMDVMRKHPFYGAKIIGEHPRLTTGRKIALSHHERWDGSGYPQRLRGEEIPVEGRIVSLADQYDALRNPRAYKPAFSHADVFDILTKGDGRTQPAHFDPRVLAIFRDFNKEFEDIYERMQG